MPETTGRLLSIAEAAGRLGVHQKTLRRWADRGLVPVVKLPSGYRRFDPAAIEQVRAGMGMSSGVVEEQEDGDPS